MVVASQRKSAWAPRPQGAGSTSAGRWGNFGLASAAGLGRCCALWVEFTVNLEHPKFPIDFPRGPRFGMQIKEQGAFCQWRTRVRRWQKSDAVTPSCGQSGGSRAPPALDGLPRRAQSRLGQGLAGLANCGRQPLPKGFRAASWRLARRCRAFGGWSSRVHLPGCLALGGRLGHRRRCIGSLGFAGGGGQSCAFCRIRWPCRKLVLAL